MSSRFLRCCRSFGEQAASRWGSWGCRRPGEQERASSDRTAPDRKGTERSQAVLSLEPSLACSLSRHCVGLQHWAAVQVPLLVLFLDWVFSNRVTAGLCVTADERDQRQPAPWPCLCDRRVELLPREAAAAEPECVGWRGDGGAYRGTGGPADTLALGPDGRYSFRKALQISFSAI